MTYSDYRRVARENLRGNWGLSIGVCILAAIMGGMLIGSSFLPQLNIKLENQDIKSWEQFFRITLGSTTISVNTINLVHFILGGVIQLGYAQFLLKQYNRATFEVKDLFSQFDRFGQGFAQAFLRNLYIALWSLLFIIPGIVKSYAYAMTPFIMAENPEMTASEAITASIQLMDGHKGELFTLDLTFIGWDLLCMLTLNIGHIWLNPYRNAAYAAFYKDLTAPRITAE